MIYTVNAPPHVSGQYMRTLQKMDDADRRFRALMVQIGGRCYVRNARHGRRARHHARVLSRLQPRLQCINPYIAESLENL